MTESTKLCSLTTERTNLKKILSFVIDDASKDVKDAEKLLFNSEVQFVKDWKRFQKNPKNNLDGFLERCSWLVNVISKKNQTHKEFQKSLKYGLEEYDELNKKIDSLKNQLSKKKGDKNEV